MQLEDINPRTIYTAQELQDWYMMVLQVGTGEARFVADVETFGTNPKDGKLLGVALCHVSLPQYPVYIVLQWFEFGNSTWIKNSQFNELLHELAGLLSNWELIGHNFAYDKSWLDACYPHYQLTNWHACTRLMWHMASAPSGPRPYGLKDAQIEVLEWKEKGNEELNEQIKARGGKPGPDMYLADVAVLGRYAALDAASTALLYNKLTPFFDQYDYWWMLEKMVEYSWLLHLNTEAGIRAETALLEAQVEALAHTRAAYQQRFIELASPAIARLERIWRDDRASRYTVEQAKERFLSTWSMQKQFKLSSDKDKRELFYDILKLPVLETTKGGRPSTGVEVIKLAGQGIEEHKELIEAYAEYESAETLLNSFAKPWLGSINSGRLHPRFNPCGTVSYRLSGFKPYLLNAPFDEQELMSCLKCNEGWEGVHADFVSVEPAVTAHYSQDPSLLKVFKNGLGDVYLDLALTLFPNDRTLQEGYNSRAPVTAEVKEQFKKQRKIAKVIQLAVQYTGTKYTVSKNLKREGFNVSLAEADLLVDAYWKHFRKIRVMNESLFIKFDSQGYLRNAVGRIIRVPTHVNIKKKDGTIWEKPIGRYKDLPNRFIQSSAHDLLSFWVLGIHRLVKERGLRAVPVIADCHDSTSWQAPKEEVEALEVIFKEALTRLNANVRLTVELKVDIKRFSTLAGLKGKEL
jgi:DNA polymerase I-like protein with 3'-5' exonuclease and polymerase domains